jgi:hypothetical protein
MLQPHRVVKEDLTGAHDTMARKIEAVGRLRSGGSPQLGVRYVSNEPSEFDRIIIGALT